MTTGMKILCIHKRDLCLHCRNSNDTNFKSTTNYTAKLYRGKITLIN